MTVAIGADHAGFALKEVIRKHFTTVEFIDVGTDSEASVDYPDYAAKVARKVASGEAETGVLVCGTGVGMSMAANRIPGVRAAACSESYTARLTRDHNDANVLCIGSRVVGEGVAIDIVAAWLETGFSGGERHVRRLNKIKALDEQDGACR